MFAFYDTTDSAETEVTLRQIIHDYLFQAFHPSLCSNGNINISGEKQQNLGSRLALQQDGILDRVLSNVLNS
jgi:hypothetical protein